MTRATGAAAGDAVTVTDTREGHAMSRTAIRTTINPGEVIKVDAAELIDLERQGLVKAHADDETAAAKAEPTTKKGRG